MGAGFLFGLVVPATLRSADIDVGQGVSLSQISFRGGPNSNVGEIRVDRSALNLASGLSSGFVNVADESGNWLVRNLPVFAADVSDANFITTRFNLLGVSNGTAVSSLNLSVDYSSAPTMTFAGASTSLFTVGEKLNAVGGVDVPLVGYRAGADNSLLNFTGGPFSLTYQTGHTNVQAAANQCAPAAVANSLAWLQDTQGLPVSHPNIPGLSPDVNPGDMSLVGNLEQAMGRPVESRTEGSGVWPLDGKLKYLGESGLSDRLHIKHVGGGGTGAGGVLNGDSNYTSHGVTSVGQGSLTWDWIQSELAAGEDVELAYRYAGGGAHYVEVTGAGTILGIPFITHISDQVQSDQDPTDSLGTDTVQFDFMLGSFLTSENATVEQAISQSVPESSSSAILAALGFGVLVLLRRCSRRGQGPTSSHSRRAAQEGQIEG